MLVYKDGMDRSLGCVGQAPLASQRGSVQARGEISSNKSLEGIA